MDTELLSLLRRHRFVRPVSVEEFVAATEAYGYKCDKWTVFKWESGTNKKLSKISALETYSRFYGINIDGLLGKDDYYYNVLYLDWYAKNTPYFRLSNEKIRSKRIITNLAIMPIDEKDYYILFNDAFYKANPNSKNRNKVGFSRKNKNIYKQVYISTDRHGYQHLNFEKGTFVGYVVELDDDFEEKYAGLITYIGEEAKPIEEFDYFNYISNSLRSRFTYNVIREYEDGYDFDGICFAKTGDIKKAFFESDMYNHVIIGYVEEIFGEFNIMPNVEYIVKTCEYFFNEALDNARIEKSSGEE